MVARQQDDIIKSDIDKYLQGTKMYLCVKFGCSTPDCVGVHRQRNKETPRQTEIICITVR